MSRPRRQADHERSPVIGTRVSALLVLAMATAACGKQWRTEHAVAVDTGPVPQISAPPFVVPGESLRLEARMFGIVIGHLETGSGQPGLVPLSRPRQPAASARAIATRTEARVHALIAAVLGFESVSLETLMNLHTGLPIRTSNTVRRARDQRLRRFHRRWTSTRGALHNLHTAYAALRSWAPAVGRRGYVHGRAGGLRHRMELMVAERSPIWVNGQRRAAIRYVGTVSALSGHRPSKLEVWISDDRDRVLLRLRAQTRLGTDIELRMTRYLRPAATAAAP